MLLHITSVCLWAPNLFPHVTVTNPHPPLKIKSTGVKYGEWGGQHDWPPRSPNFTLLWKRLFTSSIMLIEIIQWIMFFFWKRNSIIYIESKLPHQNIFSSQRKATIYRKSTISASLHVITAIVAVAALRCSWCKIVKLLFCSSCKRYHFRLRLEPVSSPTRPYSFPSNVISILRTECRPTSHSQLPEKRWVQGAKWPLGCCSQRPGCPAASGT